MAKKKGVRVTIVVEDQTLERFSREVLLEFGYSRRELRVTPYPVGQGSAKDWVDSQYPMEVQAMRCRPYQELGIVVGTDADKLTVSQRARRLAAALQDNDIAKRRDDDRITLWIPKWNIETWVLYFAGDIRDEAHNYKNNVNNPDCRSTAKAFVAEYRKSQIDDTIETQPSLKLAYEETNRLDV